MPTHTRRLDWSRRDKCDCTPGPVADRLNVIHHGDRIELWCSDVLKHRKNFARLGFVLHRGIVWSVPGSMLDERGRITDREARAYLAAIYDPTYYSDLARTAQAKADERRAG